MVRLDGYTQILRPLLFTLPPELAQKAADLALRQRPAWRAVAPALRVRDAKLNVSWCGLGLENPVGLAAGYDKNCGLLPSLATLGFGYLMAGTVTRSPLPGNPKPRMFRRAGEQSLVNALGFPNKGLEPAARQLERTRGRLGDTRVAVSVSGTVADEIVDCHRRLEPMVDAVEVNISSPNTAGLRVFHEVTALAELVDRVSETRSRPLMVKLPRYTAVDRIAREQVLMMAAVCRDRGVDALTIANSRVVSDARLSTGIGGLSGRAIFPETVRMVAEVRAQVGDKIAINACGGISTGEDAWKTLEAGATTVQLFTGLIYRGPAIVRYINRELLAIMSREAVDSLGHIGRGSM